MNLFVSNVFAQASTQNANQPNPIISFLPFILIFVIFYFLMIRPQKKKMQEEISMINALSKGDEIYTKSGIRRRKTKSSQKSNWWICKKTF